MVGLEVHLFLDKVTFSATTVVSDHEISGRRFVVGSISGGYVNVARLPRKVAKSGLKIVCEAASGRVVGAVRSGRRAIRGGMPRVCSVGLTAGRAHPCMLGANQRTSEDGWHEPATPDRDGWPEP